MVGTKKGFIGCQVGIERRQSYVESQRERLKITFRCGTQKKCMDIPVRYFLYPDDERSQVFVNLFRWRDIQRIDMWISCEIYYESNRSRYKNCEFIQHGFSHHSHKLYRIWIRKLNILHQRQRLRYRIKYC